MTMLGNWGFNRIPKYNEEYFIEDGRSLDPLCPFSKPEWCECPHYTNGDIVRDFWNDKEPHIYLNESRFRFEIPKSISLNLKSFVIYKYMGIKTFTDIMKNKEFLKTNYLPLIIEDFYVDGKQNRFINLCLPELNKIGRSVILETNGVRIPVPKEVIRI